MESVSGALWNDLFFLYLAIALVVGGGVVAWLLYTLWRFRERPGDPAPVDAPKAGVIPAERGRVLWTYVMAGAIAAILFGLAFSTISAIETLEHPPEDEPFLHHAVTGFQFGWKFAYTGLGDVPFTTIGSFTVPEDTVVTLDLTSDDVWHNFAIPDYRIRIDVIPGTTNHLWFKAEEPAETHTVCVVICGAGHANMRADLHVLSMTDYFAWLLEESDKAFDKLAANTRNATFDGDAWTFDGPPLEGGKAGAVLVRNADDERRVVEVRAADGGPPLSARILEPGEAGRVYVPPRDGALVLGVQGLDRTTRVS